MPVSLSYACIGVARRRVVEAEYDHDGRGAKTGCQEWLRLLSIPTNVIATEKDINVALTAIAAPCARYGCGCTGISTHCQINDERHERAWDGRRPLAALPCRPCVPTS